MSKAPSNIIDLTTGSIFRNLVLFSMPIIFQGSLQILYNVVDRFWVGRLGQEAMAAVSVGFPVMFLMISVVIGIATGAGIMISQYCGAGERELVSRTARNFLVFGSIVVFLLSIGMYFSTDWILHLLNTPGDFFDQASSYLSIIFTSLIFMYVYNGATGIFRGIGDSITPTKVAVLSVVLNIILDPVFIFGFGPIPRMGVAGAAVATVLANAIGAAIIMVLLARDKEWVDLTPRNFRFDWTIIGHMMRLGLPTTATMVVVSSSAMVVMRFVNGLGTSAVAAYGIGIIIDSFIMMPAQSFAMAMSTIAGQNIGAGKWHRIDVFLRNTLLLSVGLAAFVGIILALTVPWIVKMFLPDMADYQDVFPMVKMYVEIMVISYVMIGAFFPINGTIRGAGDTMTAMVLVILTQLIIRIPAIILLVSAYKFNGVALSHVVSIGCGLAVSAMYYRTGRWKNRGLISKDRTQGMIEIEQAQCSTFID